MSTAKPEPDSPTPNVSPEPFHKIESGTAASGYNQARAYLHVPFFSEIMAFIEQDEILERSTWSKPLEFVLSCLGYAIGLGNVWRFPYLCYRNGGGAFLLTYCIMVLFMGMPIFLLELIVGQYSGLGPDQAFSNMAPIFNGLGYCTLVVITLITIYYMVIIAWTLFYFFASFRGELGFGSCHNDFNTIGCFSASEDSKCLPNETYYSKRCTSVDEICKDHGFEGSANQTFCHLGDDYTHINNVINRTLATYEYFREYVLGLGDSTWEQFGGLRWQLLLCLLLAWIVGFFCVIKGVKTSGKAAYFTVSFPYFILTAFVIQGVILEGAIDGILLYLTPKWEMLLEVDVWANAASQTFYSYGIGCGSLITLASYNDFRNNCLKDALIVTGANVFTSIYAGFAIFSMLGFLANQMGVSVEEVAQDGPGLAFVAYPEAILRLPGSTGWAIAFFFMLFILGIGSQFAGVEAIRCLILDKWPHLRKHQIYITLVVCLSCFILAIPMCFEGGVYLFTLMEWNTASWAILLIGACEVCVVSWFYGCNRILDDMGKMDMKLSKAARWFWWVCWVIITPVALLGVFVFQMTQFTPASYEDYSFPTWADSLGWMMGLSTLAPFVIFAAITLWKRKYTGWDLVRPTTKWKAQISKTESNLTLTKEKLSISGSTSSFNERV